MKLTKNFSLYEFNCKSGAEMPVEVLSNIKILAEQLQSIRDYASEPITINSAYRCKSHNKAIGGVSNSQHILGKAADITIKNYTPRQVVELIESMLLNKNLPNFHIGGIGAYKTFTHIDIRAKKARW